MNFDPSGLYRHAKRDAGRMGPPHHRHEVHCEARKTSVLGNRPDRADLDGERVQAAAATRAAERAAGAAI